METNSTRLDDLDPIDPIDELDFFDDPEPLSKTERAERREKRERRRNGRKRRKVSFCLVSILAFVVATALAWHYIPLLSQLNQEPGVEPNGVSLSDQEP